MNIIDELKEKEEIAIVEGLAMMSYVPSIGRVLESGGVDKFIKIVSETLPGIHDISSQTDFDNFHNGCVSRIIKEIMTSRGETLSYGQAQKPLNVFYKVYVDWSKRLKISDLLRTFLHVPLDSILMKKIKEGYPGQFRQYVEDRYLEIREMVKIKNESASGKITDSDLKLIINPNDFSLNRIIRKDMYYAWQNCLRAIYPERPVLLDILWSIYRR